MGDGQYAEREQRNAREDHTVAKRKGSGKLSPFSPSNGSSQ